MAQILLLDPPARLRDRVRAQLAEMAGPWLNLDAATEQVLGRLSLADAPKEAQITREVATVALVGAARDGDRAALERLLDLWQSDVFRWCRLLGGPKVCVDDAAHDTLLVVVTQHKTLSAPDRFRAWLWGITWRTVRGHRRRAWLRRWVPGASLESPDPGPDPLLRCERAETSARVLAVLDALPLAQRELLWLAYAEGFSRAELAATLGLAPGTLNRRLTAARLAFEQAARGHGLGGQPLGSPDELPEGAP